jgi:recombinational DNA repair ATPase RecF
MTTTATEPALRLHRLEIQSFMRVQALTVDAQGHHVTITGPNGSGKTSAVDAIWTALKGYSSKDVPEPIHKGASRASIVLDLGEYRVERRWTEKSTSLIVTAADGSRVTQAQKLLDGLLSTYSLDPVAFLERRPRDQVDDVLSIVGVKPPVAAVQELTGEECPPKPGESADAYLLRLSADDVGLYYVRRREAHRQLEQKAAAMAEQRRLVDQLGGAPKDGEGLQSAGELLKQMESLQQRADERRAVQTAAADARAEHRTLADQLASLERDLGASERRFKEFGERIIELRRQQDEEVAKSTVLLDRIAKGRKVVAECDADAIAAEEAAAKLVDPAPKITELRRQVATVESTNHQRQKRIIAAEQLQRFARDREASDADHRKLDAILAGLRDLRAHLLDGVDLGVSGLEIGDGELRHNGVPFRQASQAEQIRVAACVAMRQNPRLKLLRIDEGERLDSHSREMLLRIADEYGWQVILTCVRDGDALQVEIVDGAPSENGNGQ